MYIGYLYLSRLYLVALRVSFVVSISGISDVSTCLSIKTHGQRREEASSRFLLFASFFSECCTQLTWFHCEQVGNEGNC